MKTLDDCIAEAKRSPGPPAKSNVVPLRGNDFSFGVEEPLSQADQRRQLMEEIVTSVYLQGNERGLEAAKRIARAYVIQAVMATTVVWVAVGCLAMVLL